MRRVLFVDDEPRVLAGLRRLLAFELDEGWEAFFVTSGQQALELLDTQSIDILVTDMRMPEMSGAELLVEVHKRHPAVVRVVLTGYSGQRFSLRSLPVAHQVISKPTTPQVLLEVFERSRRCHALVSDRTLLGVIGGVEALPPRPSVYAKVTRMLADEEVSLTAIARLIESDIALTTQLIKTSNSPYFYRGNRVTNVLTAVQRLGGTRVADLVLGIELGRLKVRKIAGFSLDDAFTHGLDVAALAKLIAEEYSERIDREDAFLAGMLHDVGFIVMALRLPILLRRLLARGAADLTYEKRLVGATHGELGGALLGMWGFRYDLIEAIAYHHTPWEVPHDILGLVDIVFAAEALISREPVDGGWVFDEAERAHLARLGVDERMLKAWHLTVGSIGGDDG